MSADSRVMMRENVALAPYTTLRIGGPARFFAEVTSEADVVAALEFAAARALPVFVLGGGSNVVVADSGFPGLIIRMGLRGIEQQAAGLFAVAAGEEWDPFVGRCVDQGCAGIECLSGIPGTVGGTPVQNVGAYGQEVSDVIVSVRALERGTHRIFDLSRDECRFGYRSSIFSPPGHERYVILSVRFSLEPGGAPRVVYPDLQKHFAGASDRPGLPDVRQAVLRIRESKSMVLRAGDPDARSAGSFFKNPVVSAEQAAGVLAAAGTRVGSGVEAPLPVYPMPDGSFKLPAARLIELAGFARGFRRGRVGLSSKHTLALINCGDATARELLDLMHDIQSAVHEIFGVRLIPEPVFLGFPADL